MSATNSSTPLTETPGVPFISVIMNCYNSARYLREALDSVVAQTFTDWEIIFWDNRSTDDSAEFFKGYSDGRFRYFLAPEHTTLGKARNLAMKQARGEWVAFLDCDDLWLPQKLELQVAIINDEGTELGLVYGDDLEISKDDRLEDLTRKKQQIKTKIVHSSQLPEGHIFDRLLQDNFISILSVMVRRSAYWDVGGIDPRLRQAEDYDLLLKISKRFRAMALSEICCGYRVHETNLTHTQYELGQLESIAIVQNYLPDKSASKALKIRHTSFAVHMFRKMNFTAGLSTLFYHGDVRLFIKLLISKLFSRLERLFKI